MNRPYLEIVHTLELGNLDRTVYTKCFMNDKNLHI